MTPDLVDTIPRERQKRVENDSLLLRVGQDGRGGFLKICMLIFDINDPFPHVQSGLAKKFKESGIKRVSLIGIVPDVPESYVNVKRLWVNSEIYGGYRLETL